jgi:hypothetical protein
MSETAMEELIASEMGIRGVEERDEVSEEAGMVDVLGGGVAKGVYAGGSSVEEERESKGASFLSSDGMSVIFKVCKGKTQDEM